jgi:hypothetical protein
MRPVPGNFVTIRGPYKLEQRSQREWPQIRCAPANGRESPGGKCSGTCQCSPLDTREPVSLPKISTQMSRKFAALPRMAANLAKVNVEEHANVPRSTPANQSALQRSQREWPQIRCAPASGRKSSETTVAEHANVPPFDTCEPVSVPKISTRMPANSLRSRKWPQIVRNHGSGTCQCSPVRHP